jgi:glycosyltransferase involved in cell wall biosynthesis
METCVLPLSSDVSNTRKDSLGATSLLKVRAIAAILAYSRRLAGFIKSRGVSLVHTNSLKADLIGGIAARLAGVPVVWHVRDRIDGDYLPPAVAFLFRMLCRIIPDFVVANSGATLATLRLTGHGRQAVVYSGYAHVNGNAAVVHDGVMASALAVNSNPHAILIGIVGRIARWKGQHVFLEAAALVRKRFPAARFQIIGSALFGEEAYESELRASAKVLGIDHCVEFLGFRDDVQQLMQELDILVHASITGEPFGQVIIEAMIAGKPVVATRGGGVPEIVEDGVTGLLAPMGDAPAMADAICQLLADPARANQMGAAGRARALSHFTVELTARRFEAIVEKVLKKG